MRVQGLDAMDRALEEESTMMVCPRQESGKMKHGDGGSNGGCTGFGSDGETRDDLICSDSNAKIRSAIAVFIFGGVGEVAG